VYDRRRLRLRFDQHVIIRASIIASLLWLAESSGATPRIRDPEVVRTDLRSVMVRRQEPKGARGAMVEVAREYLTYDASGHLTQHEHREASGQMVVRMDYVFDKSGRLLETRYRDHKGRSEIRRYTYKLDDRGRISERDMRNPFAPPGEFHRDIYSWEGDGGHSVRKFRHYAKEGPYPDGFASFDGHGKARRHCTGEHCSMYEYDGNGEVSRIREQDREHHFYRVHENSYDENGRLVRRRIGGSETTLRHNARGDIEEEQEKSLKGEATARLLYEYKYR
jgi:hypothetical protein